MTAGPRRVRAAGVAVALMAPLVAVTVAGPTFAAKSDGCLGGGYSLVNLTTGSVVARGEVEQTIARSAFGAANIGVRGRYNTFNIRPFDFAVLRYAFTGAANAEDITGGRRTPVFKSKVPDHRGLVLTGGLEVQIEDEELSITRTGPGLSMKIQAKDCAQGGIFQMEPERGDETRTRVTHTLAKSPFKRLTPFYFDNPRFRARAGQFLGSECQSRVTGPPSRFCVEVETRTNIGNGFSADFVARDSAQVAERVPQPACNTAEPVRPSVKHCGGVSVWDVASGGRMGFVTGEDAVEVANPPTECVTKCQAQNQVRGRLAVLGFPFPVPAGSRLTPRVSTVPLPPLTP
jgi:hypothetical protein